jgi:hypothetical protein
MNIATDNQAQNVQINHTTVNVRAIKSIAPSAETTHKNYPPASKVDGTSDVGIRTEKSHYEIRCNKKDDYIRNGAANSNNNFYGVVGNQDNNRWKRHGGNSFHTNAKFQGNPPHAKQRQQPLQPFQIDHGLCDELSRFCKKLRTHVHSPGSTKIFPVNLRNSEECSSWMQLWSLTDSQLPPPDCDARIARFARFNAGH